MSREIFQKMATLEEQLSWTVQPTDPVLPPYGELTKVTGVIERIHVEKQERDFTPENYKVAEYETNRTQVLNRVAAVLSFLGGQVAMLANAGKIREKGLKTTSYFINVQVNGIVYRGWAGACPFGIGDEVELAVEWQNDHYELYAIVRPKDKMISVCPKCIKGKKEYIKELISEAAVIYIILTIFFNAFSFNYHQLFDFYSEFYLIIILILVFVIFVYSLKIPFEFNTLFNTNVKLAEQIFKTFGFKDPQKINLQKITKKRLKKSYKETGIKLTKVDYEKQPMQYKFWSSLTDCYLYYYE